MPLREYQTQAIQDIHNCFANHRSVLLQMPTGTGKTEVFCQLIKEFLTKYTSRRIVVLVHRNELIEQIKERLRKFGITAGKVQSIHPFDPDFQIHVCSIDTLVRRNYELYNPSLIVIDEAHHAIASTYRTLIDRYTGTDTHLLGVTATPVRLDGKALSDVFEQLIVSKPIRWFIQEGHLSKIRYYAIDRLSTSGLNVNKITNDYEDEDAYNLMNAEKVMAEICTAYQRYAEGKKTLIFCVNQKHSENLKKRFDDLGIISHIIDSNTPPKERVEILQHFRNNHISILINVNIFTEGFDCPDIEAVILARPTKSLTLFLQMIGRVTRVAENKAAGVVLDNADNFKEHGHPTSFINWNDYFDVQDINEWTPVDNILKPIKKKKRKTPAESLQFEMVEIIDTDFEPNEEEISDNSLPENIINISDNSILIPDLVYASIYYRLFKKDIYDLEIDFSYHYSLLDILDEKLKKKGILKFCSELVMDLSILEPDPGICVMKILLNGKQIEKEHCQRFNTISLPPENYEDIMNRVFCFVWNTIK